MLNLYRISSMIYCRILCW